MQNKESFEGAKTYLKSTFRTGIAQQEMWDKQAFMGAILYNWKIGDIIQLFYETLIWSIEDIDKNPENHSHIWRAGFGVDSEVDSLWVKYKHEDFTRVYQINLPYRTLEHHWGVKIAQKCGYELEFTTIRCSSDIAAYFEFYFCGNIYFKHQPYLSFSSICDYGWNKDEGGMDYTNVVQLYKTRLVKGAITSMHHCDPALPIPPACKLLFKGKKYFLEAIRYFFKCFAPKELPSLRQIKKYMLKNNLLNPFQTFWV